MKFKGFGLLLTLFLLIVFVLSYRLKIQTILALKKQLEFIEAHHCEQLFYHQIKALIRFHGEAIIEYLPDSFQLIAFEITDETIRLSIQRQAIRQGVTCLIFKKESFALIQIERGSCINDNVD